MAQKTLTKKKQLGQFFTTNEKVQKLMVSLIDNNPHTILEPSCGEGHLISAISHAFPHTDITGVEYDSSLIQQDSTAHIIHDDFFSFTSDTTYDAIIGNPPYVAWKNATDSTQQAALEYKKNYSDKANLYYLFIDKCIDLLSLGGSMVMICPKEWMYTTSASFLREKMMHHGSFTHIIDGGEEKVFDDADVPSLMIFCWVKGKKQATVSYAQGYNMSPYWEEKKIIFNGGSLTLCSLDSDYSQWRQKVGDLIDVKVGIVSGADKVFNITSHENKDLFIKDNTVRKYLTTKGVEYFIDVSHICKEEKIPHYTYEYLCEYKDTLLSRGIKKFTTENWWHYGAIRNKKLMESSTPRLFCYGRTRKDHPFFTCDKTPYYSGGILGLFLKEDCPYSPEEIADILNNDDFRLIMKEAGLVNGNKTSLQPSTLQRLIFPG